MVWIPEPTLDKREERDTKGGPTTVDTDVIRPVDVSDSWDFKIEIRSGKKTQGRVVTSLRMNSKDGPTRF